MCCFVCILVVKVMEIHQTSATGVTLKFSEAVVTVNSSGKNGGTPKSTAVLCTYPVPVEGWLRDTDTNSGQHVFYGPGEYEKDNLYIRGADTETVLRKKKRRTTTWCVDAEGIRVLVLGDVNDQKDLLRAIADFGDVDVLISFCLKTEDMRLDAVEVAGISASTQAQRIVPIGDDEVLKDRIAKELGNTEEAIGKYVLRKKDFLEGALKVVLFV